MVVSATFIKPVDSALIKRLVREKYNIISLEDNVAIGGFGSLLLKNLAQLNYKGKFRMMAFKDRFIEHGSVDELYKQEKMDVETIAKNVKKLR